MVKSKRTEHGAERGLWDGEAHRHYRENFLGQWQPLLTCCRSPAMSASRRLRFFLFSSSPGRTTSLPTSPWPNVRPPPRALCASNGVDLALSPDCPKELYPGHELTAAVLPPCWKIADNICWSRCSREIQFSSPSRSAPHLTLRDRRVRLSSRGIFGRCAPE